MCLPTFESTFASAFCQPISSQKILRQRQSSTISQVHRNYLRHLQKKNWFLAKKCFYQLNSLGTQNLTNLSFLTSHAPLINSLFHKYNLIYTIVPDQMRVGFVDHGEWFLGYVSRWLSHVFPHKRIHYEINPMLEVDLLFFTRFGSQTYKQYSPLCPRVFICGESNWLRHEENDANFCIVTTKLPTYSNFFYCPFYITSMYERKFHSLTDLIYKKKPIYPKAKFCAFLFHNRVPIREDFFHALSTYKPVDALGRSCQKEYTPFDEKSESFSRDDPSLQCSFYDRAAEKYGAYKFVICFENASVPGYVTEKIVNAMLGSRENGGAIPIYWGAPDIEEHFNPKSFINANNVQLKTNDEDKALGKWNWTPIIDKIREIDQSEEVYQEMQQQPWLYDTRWWTRMPHFLDANQN